MEWKLLACGLAAAIGGQAAVAGDFSLLSSTETNGSVPVVSGTNNTNSDRLFLNATAIGFSDPLTSLIPQTIQYEAFSTTPPRPVTGTGTLTLLDHRVTEDVVLAGDKIGNLYDFVFRDSRDNRLVFGTRVTLGVDSDQVDNAELNFLYRRGFSGAVVQAAWLFVSNFDLRLYNAGRTASNSLTGARPFDADTVRLQSDINLSEGNPFSGLFLLKTDAQTYTVGQAAVGLFQAGEEGQPRVGVDLEGFVALVPEPGSWALMLAGGALLAGLARRRVHRQVPACAAAA